MILTPPQFALGVSAADLAGRNTLVVDINGTEYTVQIPNPFVGQYWFADRTSNTSDLTIALAAAMTTAEGLASTGGIWTVEWDLAGVVGYYRLRRSIANGVIKILWDHADTTAVAQWWGFSQTAEAVSTKIVPPAASSYDAIDSVYQCGLLWLPEAKPLRWHRKPVRVGRTRFRAFNGKGRRFGHGGYYVWEIALNVRALFVFADRSKDDTFRRARVEITPGDPNVSWEGGIWQWLYELPDSPLRIWRSREILTEHTNVQIWRPEELDELETFKDLNRSPQEFSCALFPFEEVA